MNTFTTGMLLVAAIAMTLGLINLRLWLAEIRRWDFLAIAASCFGTAVYAGFEVAMLRSDSPVEFGQLLWWAHIPAWFSIAGSAWFIYLHLQTGRLWMFWSIVGIRTLCLAVNFVSAPNLNFREITSLRTITLFGESLAIPVGVPSPWIILPQAGFILLIIFTVDAAMRAWRKGERVKAATVGAAGVFYSITIMTVVLSSVFGFASNDVPIVASPSILFVVVALAIELNYDIHRSERLLRELHLRDVELSETIDQLNLSSTAAGVGIWVRYPDGEVIMSSSRCREIFGFDEDSEITFNDFLERVHADDRKLFEEVTASGKDRYEIEYRMHQPDGEVRWIASHGEILANGDGRVIVREASVDITKRRLAENAAHELSHKLMDAQEKERARLARELHDDLSQSLALLSIEIDVMANEQKSDGKKKTKFSELTKKVQRLSTDVHRISHELHPAKLNQLGLAAAIRGFCRETEAARGFKVSFEAENVPRSLPNDLSLCLYRIVQEALQNVAKHSGASSVNVDLSLTDGNLCLVVADNGTGFDTATIGTKDSLGLVSMEERVHTVDGTMSITSSPGAGTKVEVSIPLRANADRAEPTRVAAT